MQFLLLLSALLSAVTGAFAGPRAVAEQVSQAEAQVVSPRVDARAESAVQLPADATGYVAAAPQPAAVTYDPPIAAAPLTDIRLNE